MQIKEKRKDNATGEKNNYPMHSLSILQKDCNVIFSKACLIHFQPERIYLTSEKDKTLVKLQMAL
jgi:hypothetical protein